MRAHFHALRELLHEKLKRMRGKTWLLFSSRGDFASKNKSIRTFSSSSSSHHKTEPENVVLGIQSRIFLSPTKFSIFPLLMIFFVCLNAEQYKTALI